jgi:hypothetical protein
MLSAIMLNFYSRIAMQNVIMLNYVMLSVVALPASSSMLFMPVGKLSFKGKE